MTKVNFSFQSSAAFWSISEPYCSSFDSVRRHPNRRQCENLLVQGAEKSHKKLLPGKQAWTGFFRPCLPGRLLQYLWCSLVQISAQLCSWLEHRNLRGICCNFRKNTHPFYELIFWSELCRENWTTARRLPSRCSPQSRGKGQRSSWMSWVSYPA